MTKLKPHAPIRRFDIFAEYNRLKAINEMQLPAAQAKGYGLWLAKVVAAQKFGRMPKPKPEHAGEGKKKAEAPHRKWHTLDDIPQTDKLFEKQIIARMGATFYRRVFAPALRKAFREGKDYRDIRDTLRSDWKP